MQSLGIVRSWSSLVLGGGGFAQHNCLVSIKFRVLEDAKLDDMIAELQRRGLEAAILTRTPPPLPPERHCCRPLERLSRVLGCIRTWCGPLKPYAPCSGRALARIIGTR